MKVLERPVERKAEYPVDPIFVQRWSPRAMSGEELGEEELMPLFEAARWAPSSFNNQPWRILYARKNTPAWRTFFSLLVDANKTWAKNAAVLLVFVSKDTFDVNGRPARTHTFDTGAAWESLALQACHNGLAIHGMQGFDYDRAKGVLEIPEGYTVEAMAALGRPGNPESLPEALRAREFPSGRKKVSEIAFEGGFDGCLITENA